MKSLQNIWFWFSLAVCPVVIILSIILLSYSIGFFVYSESTALGKNELIEIFVLTAAIVICAQRFLKVIPEAKKRFVKTEQ